ncbi:type I restriction enzyme endonuclease domain-containing protein [Campylobacter sp.]|uniref:type I restriction enzyme endonuclease domain-containing protein n=1 Tax=Campylobacter sp. TaxID=205 RepID=UPI002AA7F78D|nr:type I restriction enzyme endonuclease domain-containing protein [Campylobacter sp.]
MSSMEVILEQPSLLRLLAQDIYEHYTTSCDQDSSRVQKAMITCPNRKIAYKLLTIFKEFYPQWFEEKKSPNDALLNADELNKLEKMPTIAMVSSVGSNDEEEMNYLGCVNNSEYCSKLDNAFKEENSNFRVVIVVDMWITGFDVESLTYLYNYKPLQKHLLIQTISRVNRKYPGKEFGLIVDYIGIRNNMREAMKIYGGNTSIAPNDDDVEQAKEAFRAEMEVLKRLFTNYDLSAFLDPNCNPVDRYTLLVKAAEYVFYSTDMLNVESNQCSNRVSFKIYFLKSVQRMRVAFDIAHPSSVLTGEESALAQSFLAIAGFVRKMSGTSDIDADSMNSTVAKMVEEALKYNEIENVLDAGEEEDIFSPEYQEKLVNIKLPATKLEILVKMLRRQIKEYAKTNQVAAKAFNEMLEETIKEYHERRKHLSDEEAGQMQEKASDDIIKAATQQVWEILDKLKENKESFRKIGLTFEEKAFYDILVALRDEHNFEYGEDVEKDGVIVNEKCKNLAKKVKEIIDIKSSFADWLNNKNVRDNLKLEIKICLAKNGYPPQYSPEVFSKVMDQVENFEENSLLND